MEQAASWLIHPGLLTLGKRLDPQFETAAGLSGDLLFY
jgi:hypothetical protein